MVKYPVHRFSLSLSFNPSPYAKSLHVCKIAILHSILYLLYSSSRTRGSFYCTAITPPAGCRRFCQTFPAQIRPLPRSIPDYITKAGDLQELNLLSPDDMTPLITYVYFLTDFQHISSRILFNFINK